MYANTRSEEVIGKAIDGYRDQVIVATKVGWDMGEGPNQAGLSRRHILWQIRESLRRLHTDFIDLYYLHKIDPTTPLEESLRTMHNLVQEGIVRYVGCSNFAVWQIAEANEICSRLNLENFVVVQPPYSLLQRDVEVELLPYCQKKKLGVLSYSPLKGGFLTGKYSRGSGPPADSRGKYNPGFWERLNIDRNFMLIDKLTKVAKNADMTLLQLSVSWILKHPAITSIILGASTPQQIEENCKLVDSEMSSDLYREVQKITNL